MSLPNLKILASQETFYFSQHDSKLCQWIMVELEVSSESILSGEARIRAVNQEVRTPLEIHPGVHQYRVYTSTLWPEHAPEPQAQLTITAEGVESFDVVSVGGHRPWLVYLLADVCTDATWVYDNFKSVVKDDADLTLAEVELAEATRGVSWENHNHYNLVHSIELEYFEQVYPDHVERLAEAIRQGEISLNPFYNMTLTQNLTLEEQIRHFYTAREWANKYGLKMAYANHQETPSIAWDMPGILAGIGVRHLIKAILPYECPWVNRLSEPPLFIWEGVDGTQILLRRRNWDYVEGNFVLKGLEATNKAMHEQVIPEYQKLGERYPFNIIALLGCYGDLIPFQPGKSQSKDLPSRKAETISTYNNQGWEYPKLVNAAHGQFWEDIEIQIAHRGIQLEIYRGDYGTGWDTWPACLAKYVAGWRCAQEAAGLADKLGAVLSVLAPYWFAENLPKLQTGWRNLRYLGDHAWNGANDANRALNASLRKQWQAEANAAFDQFIAGGLQVLGGLVPSGDEHTLIVFNGLPWQRNGVVRVEGLEPGCTLVDTSSGETVLSQVFEEKGVSVTYFEAREVPSVGYRTYTYRPAMAQPEPSAWSYSENGLEGPFYRLQVSQVTGGITSLFDKVRGKELVDASSPFHLNQAIYTSGDPADPNRPYPLMTPPHVENAVQYTAEQVTVEPGPCGAVSASLVVRAALKNHQITSTITLYTGLDHIDIRNKVEKEPTSEKQELHFAFPFDIPNRQYRFESPGAIIEPGADQLPGAGLSAATVRHFVDVFNKDYGVTLSQADSFIVQWGERTTTTDPQTINPNSTLMVLAMGNIYDSNEAIRDQNNERHFTFRFRLHGHGGGFDPVAAVQFGWEDNNDMMAVTASGDPHSQLPVGAYSFIAVEPQGTVLTSLKPGEEGGLIARLWEVAGSAADVQIQLAPALSPCTAALTDHLETDQSPLPVVGAGLKVPVRPRGVSTVRIVCNQ
jgi:alpha-mannosidase